MHENRPIHPNAIWSALGAIAIALIIYFARPYFTSQNDPAPSRHDAPPNQPAARRDDPTSPRANPPASIDHPIRHPNIAFRSRAALEDHYKRHAQDVGATSLEDYLQKAQSLRDAPLAAPIQELKRTDGVVTRFDPRTGYFLAANADQTIRTFFRPADGQAYFTRQATRPPND